jgi:hypothetical protein
MFRFHHFFLYLCIYAYHSSVLHYFDRMNYLVADGANSLRKGRVCDVSESPTHRCGAFPPVPPPMPLASLEQLLAPLNAIMQSLAASVECQAGQSQQPQQPQESSYLDFLASRPPKFAETIDPLDANHWLHVIESKFRLLNFSEF